MYPSRLQRTGPEVLRASGTVSVHLKQKSLWADYRAHGFKEPNHRRGSTPGRTRVGGGGHQSRTQRRRTRQTKVRLKGIRKPFLSDWKWNWITGESETATQTPKSSSERPRAHSPGWTWSSATVTSFQTAEGERYRGKQGRCSGSVAATGASLSFHLCPHPHSTTLSTPLRSEWGLLARVGTLKKKISSSD